MIDDESKKFIKDTIEDAIDKKLDDRDKKSAAQKRIEDLKNEKKSLEDRKKLLAELQERDKKGENTIAQKFEMLKLSVDNAIPQDLKDAYSGASKTIGSGASQVGKGLGHLTQKAMLSNPLTAFLYQNRDVFGAVGDIGIGAAKMGWGAVKGIGHGALGLANTAMNMFKPKEEEQTEEEEYELPKTLFGGKEESLTDKLADEQQDWQKKINQMHKILTQDLSKEQKKSSDIMSKGLGGLNKTMEAIKGFTDVIASKQKLILGGVLLGAAAIVALAAWFKSGALQKLIKGALGQDDEGEGFEAGMDFLKTQDAANMTNTQVANTLINPNNNKDVGFTSSDIHKFNNHLIGGKEGGKEFRKYAKSLGVSNTILNTFDHNITKHEITQSKNTQTTVLTFPFRVYITKVVNDPEQPQYIALQINRAIYATMANAGGAPGMATTGVGSSVKTWQHSQYSVVYTKVLEQLVAADTLIPENTPIAVLDAGYQVLGDIEKFMEDRQTGTELTNYAQKRNEQMANFSTNYSNFRNEEKRALHKNQAVKQANKIQNETATKNKGLGAKMQEAISDFVAGSDISNKDFETQTAGENENSSETPSVSTNQVKADEQNKKLNESTKKTETEKTSNNDVQGQKLSSASTTMQLPGTGYRYADKGLTTTEYNNMRDTDIV